MSALTPYEVYREFVDLVLCATAVPGGSLSPPRTRSLEGSANAAPMLRYWDRDRAAAALNAVDRLQRHSVIEVTPMAELYYRELRYEMHAAKELLDVGGSDAARFADTMVRFTRGLAIRAHLANDPAMEPVRNALHRFSRVCALERPDAAVTMSPPPPSAAGGKAMSGSGQHYGNEMRRDSDVARPTQQQAVSLQQPQQHQQAQTNRLTGNIENHHRVGPSARSASPASSSAGLGHHPGYSAVVSPAVVNRTTPSWLSTPTHGSAGESGTALAGGAAPSQPPLSRQLGTLSPARSIPSRPTANAPFSSLSDSTPLLIQRNAGGGATLHQRSIATPPPPFHQGTGSATPLYHGGRPDGYEQQPSTSNGFSSSEVPSASIHGRPLTSPRRGANTHGAGSLAESSSAIGGGGGSVAQPSPAAAMGLPGTLGVTPRQRERVRVDPTPRM